MSFSEELLRLTKQFDAQVAEARKKLPKPKAKPCKTVQWDKPLEMLAVEPDQIPAAKEAYRRQGVDVNFTPGGSPIVTGRRHYYALARANGYEIK